MGNISDTMSSGITLKSKGKIEIKVTIAAIPNKFKIISVVSLNMYRSKAIKILCPIIEIIKMVVTIGSHELKSSVNNGYRSHWGDS